MYVYQLQIEPLESDSEAEDHDEWFGSKAAAFKRRAELRRTTTAADHRTGYDFGIQRWEVKQMPMKQLVLALLNRRSWSTCRPTVIAHEVALKGEVVGGRDRYTLRNMRGIAPNLAHGLSAEEHVRQLRDDREREPAIDAESGGVHRDASGGGE